MESVYPVLAQIVGPQEVKKLSRKELHELAKEVRQAILDNVSQTGGHFSSNLGTVELTVALFATLNMPPDKVVWDTGHQAYPHKLLTGRLPRFGTLRQYKGLSGFLKREEHELDVFGAGHAGTAVSAALGFALARDQVGGTEKVVAITGDSAICSGMSWEALNHAGELESDIMVVLNDNRMSIAPATGALNNYLSRLRAAPQVQKLARAAKGVVEQIPGPASRIAAGLRHGVTHLMAPEQTGTIFEEMGFEYIGALDGHDLDLLLDVFSSLYEAKGPLFVHALTTKGKGYEVAENDATKWHGVVPFNLNEKELPTQKAASPAYTALFGRTLMEMAAGDPTITVVTAGMPDGTGLVQFSKDRPQQFHDVGIAEEHAVTMAAGMAAGGLKPYVAIYSTFLQRAFDQIIHDVCLQKLPVRFCLDRAGLVGADGPTHHGALDLSFLGMMPGMTILAPRDGTELNEMLRWMQGYEKGPTAIRYPRGTSPESLPESRSPIALGKGEILGDPPAKPDVLIISIGSMVAPAWEASLELASQGVKTAVINARFAKPLDKDLILDWASRAKAVITVEENSVYAGLGWAVRDVLYSGGFGSMPHKLMALPDGFVEHGTQAELLRDVGLTKEDILREAKALSRPRKA